MRGLILLMVLAAPISPALAAPREAPAPAPPVEAAPPPPYQPQILRLSELLGVLAYMSDLCGVPDADTWRTRMGVLLTNEGPSGTPRDLMAGAYNRGFHSYEASYRVCTANAQLVISRSLDEAGRIAGTIVSRFGAS